jgi:shikimate kinase
MWTSFVGFLASGKSSIATALGQGTGLAVVDLDRAVEELAGCALPEIFNTGGSERVRQLEIMALLQLKAARPLLLATGAGCIESAEMRGLLRQHGMVIWLDAPWEVLRARIEAGGSRRWPMIAHVGWGGLQQLYYRRLRLYAAVADFRLSSAHCQAPQLASQALLRRLLWRQQQQGAAG